MKIAISSLPKKPWWSNGIIGYKDNPFMKNGNPFTYLGYVKNTSHYINEHNEVFSKMPNGNLEYVADWLDEHKMLWTDYPITYRLVSLKEQNYFYDVKHKDAYYYDKDMQLVIPAGFYDKTNNVFIHPFI